MEKNEKNSYKLFCNISFRIIIPIRGGTDGSKISYMGIPTPNIFVGGENFHGQYEFSCLEHMEKAADTIVEIAKLAKK